MKRRAFGLVVATAVLITMTVISPAGAKSPEITVMSRNLYLGADVGEALKLMPDTTAAAQFMWDQVGQTDFGARAALLAAETAAVIPSVIGLQEATTWVCTKDANTEPVTIFDFTKQFLDATATSGTEYVIAASGDDTAVSVEYTLGPIVGLTIVNDPSRFQPLFGSDQASCGFRIADVLAVRADLAAQITAVGTATYDTITDVVPGFITIHRGYAWADMSVGSATVRLVTTHLESTWNPNSVPAAVLQARELIADHEQITGPLVVMGDFNNDPRDPRPAGQANPGGQPEASAACPDPSCNSYWSMVNRGFTDAGPDATDPRFFSWGADATLAGPSTQRAPVGREMGNPVGFTDRLDYVFVRNGVQVLDSSVIGNEWPSGLSTWTCSSAEQVRNTAAAATQLGVAAPAGGVCFATDHAGIVAVLAIGPAGAASESGTPILVWIAIAAAFVVVVVVIVAVVRSRSRRPRD